MRGLRGCLGLGLGLLLLALVPAVSALPAPALSAQPSRFLCDGDPLVARIDNGAVDALGIPNTVAGTLPGAFVVIDWRDLHLQLPRTNNAGPPSFTDGRWWWSLEDPEHPTLLRRRAEDTRFACRPLEGTAAMGAATVNAAPSAAR